MQGLSAALDRLSGREKVMVGVMGASVLVFLLFVGVLLIGGRLAEQEERIESAKASLDQLMARKDEYLAERARSAGADESRIEGNDLNLTTFADKHAKTVGIQFDDYNDSKRPLFLKKRPPGGRVDEKPDLIEEHLEVTFKRVSLEAVTAFLDNVDNEERRPLAVKKLNLKTLWSDRTKLSGSITLATWKKPEDET